jgi:quercetin dioxygenase-like cupin family protein
MCSRITSIEGVAMTKRSWWSVCGLALTVLMAGVAIGVALERIVLAQPAGIKRTPLVTVDQPGTTGYEAIMGLAEIPSGGTSGRHIHHGVEIGYVLDGAITIQHEGRAVQTVKAGEAFRIGAKAAHDATASGGAVTVLTVHMVEKGKPLAEPVK